MDMKWDISNIYTSVVCSEFKDDIVKYRSLIEKLNNWCKENFKNYDNTVQKLEKYINMKNEVLSYSKLMLYVNLAQSVDTTNEEIAKAADTIEAVEAEMAYQDTAIVEFIKGIDNIEDIIKESSVVKEHSFYLSEIKEKGDHILSAAEEIVISKMKNTGSLMWEKQWNQLSSTLTACYNNCEIPLSEVRNLAYDKSAEVRKAAYEAEIKAYSKIEQPCAFCMNGIKGEVITLSDMRGYSSPLDMTLKESRIDRDVLDAMFSAVEAKLPELQEYFAVKSKALGNEGPLPYYDLFAPLGINRKKYTPEEARDFVLKSFYGFSNDLGNFAQNAFDRKWLDIMPSKGKVGGAYCESIHSMKESRILLNFGGAFDDVVTIAHELGHGFHNTRLFDLSELNSFYPMPIAETASTFCESIVVNEALKNADVGEKINIIESDIMGLTQCVVDIYSRFLFEDAVFEKRREGPLSCNELSDIMIEAEKKAYGKGLDERYLHRYMWVCKPHYYDGEFNYYNFPYAFGALLSKGLYSLYKKMGEDFLPLYDKILSASSTMKLKDVAGIAGIDIRNIDFWLTGIDEITGEIDELKKMLYTNKPKNIK